MISNTDSILCVYSTEHIRVKVYLSAWPSPAFFVSEEISLSLSAACAVQLRHVAKSHPGIRNQHRRLYCPAEQCHGFSRHRQGRGSGDGGLLCQNRYHH